MATKTAKDTTEVTPKIKMTSKRSSETINTGTDIKPSLPTMLSTLTFLRVAKNKSDKEIHSYLDKAYSEVKKHDMVLLLERVMLHMGDISRQHNLFKEFGITSKTGGAQERAIFRSCLRWWAMNLPESFKSNLRVFAEFTLYENLMYYQITTDRFKGSILNEEILFPIPEAVHDFLATQIRNGKDTNLIAKHLPKYSTGKNRVGKYLIRKKKGKLESATSFEWKVPKKNWVKVNGVEVKPESTITVKLGDIITYPRTKQGKTLEKQKYVNSWISSFCEVMGWSLKDYKEFRKKQNTPEQKFSSKEITKIAKSEFFKMLDGLTSGQRFRVAKMLAAKDGNKLTARDKWGDLGAWYIEWETNQSKVADKLRVAAESGDETAKVALMKELKVKSTGIQTIDLLVEMFKGQMTPMQIDTTYQSMIEKMDLIANVFPIVDGSGSMDSAIDYKGTRISNRAIAYSMLIAFSTRNPVEAFRNTYGWFSSNFSICGTSKFVDDRPNPYVNRSSYRKPVKEHQTISPGKTFTENYEAIRSSDPGEVASTNMFASVEHFVALVKDGKFHLEDLPTALLYITDMENNTGKSPKEAIILANSIGWNPLLIFWAIQDASSSTKNQFKDVKNALFVSGFNEGVLSQILRGIKTGAVDPQLELWSIFEDARYSVLK